MMKILFFYMIAIVVMFDAQAALNPMRLLLADVRGGQYAHPGETEILDRIMQDCQLVSQIKLLDVGSGFGGSLAYMQQQVGCEGYGIDIDPTVIAYAQKQYAACHFIVADALQLDSIDFDCDFDVITMVSVTYAIADKKYLFEQLAQVAHTGTQLVLFDYAVPNGGQSLSVKDFNGRTMYPIVIDQITEQLQTAGWYVVKMYDLRVDFLRWYEEFLQKLADRHDELTAKYGKDVLATVRATFTYFHDQLMQGVLSGILIYAVKR